MRNLHRYDCLLLSFLLNVAPNICECCVLIIISWPQVLARIRENQIEPIILLWTKVWGESIDEQEYLHLSCSQSKISCRISDNRILLTESAAVVFHARDVSLSDLPNKVCRVKQFEEETILYFLFDIGIDVIMFMGCILLYLSRDELFVEWIAFFTEIFWSAVDIVEPGSATQFTFIRLLCWRCIVRYGNELPKYLGDICPLRLHLCPNDK